VVSLLVLGGAVIRDFAFALMIGVVVGTYSTIYVASSMLIFLERRLGPTRPARG
jgi:preprotein translocase subunit SecF